MVKPAPRQNHPHRGQFEALYTQEGYSAEAENPMVSVVGSSRWLQCCLPEVNLPGTCPIMKTWIISPWHDLVTWYKITHADAMHLPLFWKSHSATSSPACMILYHVTGSRKGPINNTVLQSFVNCIGFVSSALTKRMRMCEYCCYLCLAFASLTCTWR